MLTRVTSPSLPGIVFAPPPMRVAADLPPLDVAAFTGFAERGPLDLPVAIEDLSDYHSVFGGNLALASDTGDRPVFAQLPGAVADFFVNGGRRCYAVRVAGAQARPARFVLPGLIALNAGVPLPVIVDASSPGRWADRLALAARLETAPLPVARFQVAGARRLRWDPASAPAALRRGDLLRLSFDDGRKLLAPIDDIVRPAGPLTMIDVELAGAWDLLLPIMAPDQPVVAARLLGMSAAIELRPSGPLRADGSAFSIEVAAGEQSPAVGDILELDVGGWTLLVTAAEVRRLGGSGSPAAECVEVRGVEALASGIQNLPIGSPPATLHTVERLRMAVVPRLDQELRPTIGDLGFNAGHPRFWGELILLGSSMRGRLPHIDVDARWLVNEPRIGEVRESLLPHARTPAASAAETFFTLTDGKHPDQPLDPAALASLFAPIPAATAAQVFLPVGMPAVLTVNDFTGPSLAGDDGLTELRAELFLDPALSPARSPAGLLLDARDRYDVQGLRLRGVHSLLVVDEVAMIAVPDAAQRPWEESVAAPIAELPAAPPMEAPALCLERVSEFEDCDRPPVVTALQPPRGTLAGGTVVTIEGSGFDEPYGVQVLFGTKPALEVEAESDTRLHCRTPAGGAPDSVDVTITTRAGSGMYRDAFTYQAESTVPQLPRVIPARSYTLGSAPLLGVQRELIIVCQARQDASALLGLPEHFTRRECINWQQELRATMGMSTRRIAGGDAGPLADLSYAAVYHPWLVRSAQGVEGTIRSTSPEGAAAGLIAAHEHERGAWITPANRPLQGTLGLTPALSTDDWAELFAQQFNLVRPEANDFRIMGAHTLSDERALLQLSVRRLLILLRKMVFERGMEFVFESNHERFREGTRALLRRTLHDMYERGAFAGNSPEQAYQVDTGPALNPPESVDQGRFVAEVRVAPSQPMEFIRVVLTRADDGQLRVASG